MTSQDARSPLTEQTRAALLLEATGRPSASDALRWIAEGRAYKLDLMHSLMPLLVEAADDQVSGAEAALRVVAQQALKSTLDTSADLVSVDEIVEPANYDSALLEVAQRTASGSLVDISVNAVISAQSANPLVIEALTLVAGLSWRDLRDRANAAGVRLPGRPLGPWSSAQMSCAFGLIDQVVSARVIPQLIGATAARPLELLLPRLSGWGAVEQMRTGGVTYGVLLAQRDVGSAWSAHRNRTNNEISRLIIGQLLSTLNAHDIPHWSTEGTNPVSKRFLSDQVARADKVPGQLSVVTRSATGSANSAVLVSIARDGGTARKTAATFLKVPDQLTVPGILLLVGTGWADRAESDRLIRAFAGRVYTEHSLPALASEIKQLTADNSLF